MSSPCITCGACCAAFRVDFHPVELAGGVFAWGAGVPREMTVPVTARLVRMAGTDASPPRCVALEGVVGEAVACRIYGERPSPCREFDVEHAACARARRQHGLPPLPERG
ncbi:YkgJ family cysteine cluster protein [Azovibrio restrictus]|uniref:YkgJ family cysteine cluster protein n=1 Tax=Azovibrio restrictus TaxID=146938 RepID=UPI0026ED736B|nr:YkgJ family cysteine cluster protein [Azovibrio restrictus]